MSERSRWFLSRQKNLSLREATNGKYNFFFSPILLVCKSGIIAMFLCTQKIWLVWMGMRLVYATSNYIIETYFVLFRIIFYIPVSLMWFIQVIVLCYFLKLCLFLSIQNTFFKLVGKFSLTPMQLKPFTVQLYFVGNITVFQSELLMSNLLCMT